MKRFLTPLAKARGHGSAHEGVHHWWMQRLTAVAMLPLSFWLIFTIANLTHMDLETVRAWMLSPLNALFFTLFMLAMFYHAKLGMQVIIEDYVHCKCWKYTLLITNSLGFVLLSAVTLMSVLKLHWM